MKQGTALLINVTPSKKTCLTFFYVILCFKIAEYMNACMFTGFYEDDATFA